MDLNITNMRVLVTAGAAAIGCEIACAFVREGARVHVCDIDREALKAFASSEPGITQSVCDVADRDGNGGGKVCHGSGVMVALRAAQ